MAFYLSLRLAPFGRKVGWVGWSVVIGDNTAASKSGGGVLLSMLTDSAVHAPSGFIVVPFSEVQRIEVVFDRSRRASRTRLDRD